MADNNNHFRALDDAPDADIELDQPARAPTESKQRPRQCVCQPTSSDAAFGRQPTSSDAARQPRRAPASAPTLDPATIAISINRLNGTLERIHDENAALVRASTCPLLCVGAFTILMIGAFGVYMVYRLVLTM